VLARARKELELKTYYNVICSKSTLQWVDNTELTTIALLSGLLSMSVDNSIVFGTRDFDDDDDFEIDR
jgi:hypothetical protein